MCTFRSVTWQVNGRSLPEGVGEGFRGLKTSGVGVADSFWGFGDGIGVLSTSAVVADGPPGKVGVTGVPELHALSKMVTARKKKTDIKDFIYASLG
jgi:hypothetical protein